jgi:hypothetical protein
MEERLFGPRNEILINELLQLRIVKDKVDHPRTGSKDLADATCGAIYNAISRTPVDLDKEIEIHNYDWEDEDLERKALEDKGANIIQLPESREMPSFLHDFMYGDADDPGRDFSNLPTII